MYQFNWHFLILFLIQNISCTDAELCAIDLDTPVNLSPPDIADIISYIQSQYTPDIIEDVLITNVRDAQDIEDYDAGTNNEDIHLPIMELINKYGYRVEQHEVVTEDGYCLAMQRIPKECGPVVYLQHGICSSADDFVTAGPEEGLPFILADKGYDVWMGNFRGNKHSEKHVSMSPECAEFWDFSWDEIGRYDLPAMIDYTLNVTGKTKLNYVGHSQGTTTFFVMSSMLPEYNEKISLMIALSPIAWMSHLKSPLVRLLAFEDALAYKILEALGMNKLLSNQALNEALTSVICGESPFAKMFCSNLVGMLYGFDHGQLNVKALPVIFGHYPTGSSTMQLVHYLQEILSGRFCRFDYGESTNLEEYNCTTPPDYPVEKITAPMVIYYSDKDWFSNVTDVSILMSKLPNLVDSHLIKDYSHVDFIWGKNSKKMVYESALKHLAKYSST